MSLRYKISLLAIITVLVVLTPLSIRHIQSLAQAEQKEIRARLTAIGRFMRTELATIELGRNPQARQYMFLQESIRVDSSILFVAVYRGDTEVEHTALNHARLPASRELSEPELIKQLVDGQTYPSVKYVPVPLTQNRELLLGYSIAFIEQQRRQRELQAVAWAIGLMAISVIASVFFAQRLTRPIQSLTAGMARIARGDLSIRLESSSRDEIGQLTEHFNQMVADLQENVLERQRMGQELDIAQHIQQSLLPQSEPDIDGLETAGVCLTYAEVGGDYYDYLPLGERRLAVAIGDVFGHGVSSGLLAAAVQGCLRNQVRTNPDPGEVLAAVDRVVRLSGEQLMTLCYTVIDSESGRVTVASAGHWPPYHYVAGKQEIRELHPTDGIAPALGTFPTDHYPAYQTVLEQGDLLVFYSDGILEASNAEKEMYGEDRFREALHQCEGSSATEIRDNLLNDVELFRGKMAQDDDIALVVVRRV